ncbi:MAG: phosphoribosyltransferase family protein [Chitinophagaceae bacterium]
MNYRSFADLSQDIKSNLHKVPRDVSLIVGIPRSGLLAANLFAVYLNLPLTDIDSFINGKLLSTGFRGKSYEKDAFKGKILIVDDSIYSGKALKQVKEKLAQLPQTKDLEIIFCCVYVYPNVKDQVDVPLVMLDMPRVFEWNIFHHKVLESACVDIDGVLCIDPTNEENDDGENYLNFLMNASPYIVPKVKINTLVSTRLEKYRASTEAWLQKHGIQYNELVMLNLPDKATRMKMNNRGQYKAEEFKKRKHCTIFIESERRQAQTIYELSGKTVYCVDTNEMYTPQTYAQLAIKVRKRSGRLLRALKKRLVRLFSIF